MVKQSLETCGMYNLLIKKESNVAKVLSSVLNTIEPEVAKTLEYIKAQFPNFTDHGIQHSLRIINYIYSIMSEELKQNISDVEIFCFIMAAFFHDMGMTLTDVDDRDNQRANHHLYANIPIKEFFEKYLQILPERRRLEKCIIFVSEAHGKSIEDLYNDNDFGKIETIEGQVLRYGLLAILLRIGDLMDLEESRVCEFNMHMNLSYYNNPLSLVHNRRHLDDINYNYSPRKITVNVLTDDREKYKVWSQWLEYLDAEIMYANTHYLTAENSEFFRNYKLPEVVKCVKPSEDAKFAVEEIRFQVDDTGALWDIITKSIYTNEYDYIRELIQNSIDASLFKMYLDEKENIVYQSPRSWMCKDKIIIAYSENEGVLLVQDNGIGMSEKGLSNYLFKTANSGYKYMKSRKFIFPAIAKFGIGFVACLTKADKIQVLTRTQNDNGISAEIESDSTIAFIEKDMPDVCQGTTVILNVKHKYSFNELKNYVFTYFRYPSVEIDLVDIDTINIYAEGRELVLQEQKQCSLQIVESMDEKRKYKLSPILSEHECLVQLSNKLGELETDDIIGQIRTMLNNNFCKNELIKRIRSIINDIDESEEILDIIRLEIRYQRKIIDEKFKRYPEFHYSICRKEIPEIVDYKQLILEIDNTFAIKRIYKDVTSNSRKGIIYIPSNIVDYNLGIEWRSVNAFMFNDNRIVKNIVKIATDSEDSLVFTDNISLDEIADVEYEMRNRLQEQENEEYYERIVRGQYDELDNMYDYLYDAIILKDNQFYVVYDVEEGKMEGDLEKNEFLREYELLDKITIDKYQGEKILFEKSKLYQDGILLEYNPQSIVPIGVGYVVANLTAESRLELNVTRHELNNNREVNSRWVQHVGCIIQRKVAENCIRVLRKNNLDFEIEDLLTQKTEDSLEKEYFTNMKKILRELLM